MSGKFWDKAWSLIDGCTPVSAGCDNCWLARLAHRFAVEGEPGRRNGVLTDGQGRFTGAVRFRADRLDIPLRTKKPTVFAIWSDLYHEAVTDEQIRQAYDAMSTDVLQPCKHTYLIVTKRAQRAAEFCNRYMPNGLWPWPNVYHLVTVENQEMADERIPHAMKIPGKVGLLVEPMLGPVDLGKDVGGTLWMGGQRGCAGMHRGIGTVDCPKHLHHHHDNRCKKGINFVILGGETGPHARPMNPDWARSVRDQCHMAGVPFYLKFIDKKHGRLLDEQEYNELPWRIDGR